MKVIHTRALYEAGKYVEATSEGLELIKNIRLPARDVHQFCYYYITLEYALLSAYELGVYFDCYEIGKTLYRIVPEEDEKPPCDLQNSAALLERYIEACLYCKINQYSNYDCQKDIPFLLNILFGKYSKLNIVPSDLAKNIKEINDRYSLGEKPYYEVECSINYHLPMNDGDYPFCSYKNIKNINIKTITRNKNTDYEMHFTRFKIQSEGFIRANGDWSGPTIVESVPLYNTRKAIDVINEFLIVIAKADNANYYPFAYAEQVDTHIVTQYLFSGEVHNYSNFANFGSNPISIPKRSGAFTSEQNETLLKLLSSTESIPLYEKLIIIGRENVSIGQYTEAFMLLNSAVESLVYTKVEELAKHLNCQNEFSAFEVPKSKCDDCPLYSDSTNRNVVKTSELPPSIFHYADFLFTINAITKKDSQLLKQLIGRARNDDLRNKLMHGRLSMVSISDVKTLLDSIEKIDSFFKAITASKE